MAGGNMRSLVTTRGGHTHGNARGNGNLGLNVGVAETLTPRTTMGKKEGGKGRNE